MIKRNTWILLLVLVVVVAAAYGVQKMNLFQGSTQQPPTSTPNPTLLDLANDSIIGITLTDQNGLNVVAKSGSDNQWTITQPVGLQISQGNIQEILSELSGLTVQSSLLSPLPLDSTGLQLPAYTIVLAYTTGQNHTIKVGSLTPTKSGYYVQIDSGNSVIVSQYGIDNIVGMLKSVTYTPTPTVSQSTATQAPVQGVTPTP